MKKILLFLIPLLFFVFSINAQNSNAEENTAMSLVSASKAKLGLSAEDLGNVMVSSTYFDNSSGVRRVYLIQTYQGIPVYNQMLVLAYRGDQLLSQAGAFNRGMEKFANVKSGMPAVTAGSAVQSALSDRGLRATQMAVAISTKDNGRKVEFGNMGISHENITAELIWSPVENSNEMHLAWQVYIIPKTTSDYWMIRVDAVNNSILGIDNYTDYDHWGTPDADGHVKYPAFSMGNMQSNAGDNNIFDFKKADDPSVVNTATYRVIPFPAEAPSFPNGAHALRTDPWLAAPGNATTLKWNTGVAATDYNYSRGNNVWAYEDRVNNNTGSIAKSASSTTALPNLTFDFVPDFTQPPTQTTPVPNQQFNITNLFYWNNILHDVMYIYGLDEASGNFQDDNMGRGGAGNDHVNAEAQDGGGTNNANFSTPADGGSGRMQMYLWTGGNPQRDGDVDNGIVVHEFGHGISNRLTGGPATAGCLGNAEQMGEGWSDYYALMFTQDWTTATLNTGFNSPRGIGTYALFQPPTGLGIRGQRYCTDFAVNNRVYLASLPVGPHPRGEIWCATLWDMTWNIINQVGTINPNLYNIAGGGGNTIAMKLVTEGLKLQQCSPGFISGRNAILQADQNLYGGLYNCAIWEAFRRRGMGAFASEGSTASVTDQIPDFTPPITLGATVSATTIPESSNLIYTNSVTTCSAVTGYTLRDTLPTNVTHVTGGTYDAATRVVSFAVNQAAGTTNYPFTVNVNPGSYFPPVTLLTETVAGPTIPASWTTTAPLGTVWTVVNTSSNSAPNSFFVEDGLADGDQRLETTNQIALPINSYPKLSFWHRYNTEADWDGGVLEVSTNNGATWIDLGPQMIQNGYNGAMGASPNNPLGGRQAFTGQTPGTTFINTIVSLAPYAGQSVKIRFRFGSDNNTTAPTSPAGWWVDDIVIDAVAAVNMRSSLFNASNTRVFYKDMVTEITPNSNCNPVISQQPVDAVACTGSSATFTCVGTATGGVTYQWQLSTTGIGGTYTNLTNVAPYSNVTTSTMTINPTAVGLNGNYYRCVVTGTCPPNATSNPALLSVAAASAGGTVTPATVQVCGTPNTGTLTLSGHTGSVIRWESSTVGAGGPFTPIANTTTTHTFNNITQTTWFRAVVQFGTCASANSSVSQVTFSTGTPMIIIADPGTTLCQGDPTLLTVLEQSAGAPPIPVSISHSGSNAITAGNSVSCGTAITTSANSFWRVYDLAAFPAVTGNYTINTVTFGIEAATGGPQNITVRLYTQTGAAFPGGTRTQIATQTYSVPNQALTLYTATLTTPVTVPNNSVIVVEVATAGAVGTRFFIGSNAAAETDPSYLSAAACAITVPTPTAGIGFPNMHIVLNLGGTVPGMGPITGGTFLWTPAAGLSSTTSNPVAASPMTTTTYTVSHNNGAGCIRQAMITITVNQRPAVTTQPVAIVRCVGSTATFTVGATGTGLNYQWQENTAGCTGGTWNNLTNGGAYSNVNTPTLTINPVAGTMNGYGYRVIITGVCAPIGTANISNCAVLTVNPLPVVTITPVGPVCGGVAGINGVLLSTGSQAPPIPGSVTVSSGTISVPIPEGNFPTPPPTAGAHTLAVSGIPANATITGIHVTSNITHDYVGDVVLVLKAPNGEVLNLDALLNITNNPGADFVNTVISSAGVTTLDLGTEPFTGTFKADAVGATFVIFGFTLPGGPAGYAPTTSIWSDLYPNPNGNWTIAAYDPGAPDQGTLTSWEITIDYTTPGGTGTPLTVTWSPATGLYMDSTATTPYIAGTQTPEVYAAPTVATIYTATGTDTTTGCIGTSTILVNYTPAAPVVTPNPVAMCSPDNPVKLKAASTGTPAVWTPAAGLFSDAAGTVAYVAGTAVDSVWTKPSSAGVYTYQVTAQNSINVTATPATPLGGTNTNAVILFNVRNNNAVPVTFTNISSNASASGAVTSRVFYNATAIAGPPAAITVANGWNQFGTGTSTVTAGINNLLISGLTLVVPANTTYGIALEMVGSGGPAYSNGTGTIATYSSGGCDIITDGNVGWGGFAVPAQPLNNPRNFNGSVTLLASGAGTCTSPETTVVVTLNDSTSVDTQPVPQTVCTDGVTTFTVAAGGTGPFSYEWQVSTTDSTGPWTDVINDNVYSGATTATLTITAPPVSFDSNYYRVIITGAAPCAYVTSAAVMLTVNPLPNIAISANRTSLLPGLTATFTSTVTPNAAATYTWLRNGVVLTSTSQGVLSGINTGTLTVDVDGFGTYQLRVNDVNTCTNISNSIVIKDSASGKCFIYPNPSSGKFEVRYYSVDNNNNLPRSLTVYDAKGNRVLTQMYSIGRPYDRMEVDMRAYGKGLYWVEIGDRNGNRLTMCRVVIQ